MAYTQAEKTEILKDRSMIEELLRKYGKKDVLEFIDKINQEMELSKYKEDKAAGPRTPRLLGSALDNNFESLINTIIISPRRWGKSNSHCLTDVSLWLQPPKVCHHPQD